ncbi:MAG: hypothetical protein GC151_19565 [Betaproteobacteria bacterium]|nr:hypothetical protein [Betaproteobacteria bacterium]
MNISAQLLPSDWYVLAHAALFFTWLWIVRSAPWSRLADNAQSHIFLGSVVVLLVVWSIRPPALGGLDFHLLGVTAFTLMFGPQLAMAGLSVVMGGLVAMGRVAPNAYSINVLFLAVLPAALSWGVLRVADRALPRNIFVYIFVPAFFGAALAMLVTGVTTVGLVALFGVGGQGFLAEQFLPYCLFLGFAEATVTGMVVTLMVVYRPHWVGTFDDARYLSRR